MTGKRSIRHLRIGIFALMGGILFAAFDRCGYMIQNYGSIWIVSDNPWHRTIFHRIALRVPAFALAVLLCFLAADALRRRAEQRPPEGVRLARRAGRLVRAAGERTAALWAFYFASFLPAFLGGYPGLFAADAPNQIGWTFSGWLTAHHPLLHTGFLCAVFSAARTLGLSDNTAAAACTLIQMALLAWIFAQISRFLKRERAAGWLRAGTALFLALAPVHGMMAIYTTKDTLFSGVLVLCLMQIWRMCVRPETYFDGWRHTMVAGAAFILLLLLRNNGFHTLLVCIPFLLFCLRKYWRKLAVLGAMLVLVYGFYNGPLLTLLGAEPGNGREAYSIVMQTLGRTYAAGGDIRPEEMDVIRPVMDEETLALYTPGLSDPIKNYFHTDAFEENKAEFLKTWLKIGWRNKKIYVDAFLNTTLGFWYPEVGGEYLEFVCFDIQKEDPNYPHVQMEPVSDTLNRYYTAVGTEAAFRRIPAVRELLSMGTYLWLLALAALYALYRREYGRLLWTLPLWSYTATCLLGPGALLRYGYPLMLAAPVVLYAMLRRDP
ncbi:MAG: DUF6020 family protein [Eubacteriales bacterium]|nr:DUF6020 family protein [Eubacteriales bacterium]